MRILSYIEIKFLLPIMFFLVAVFVAYFTYSYNIFYRINLMEQEQKSILAKEAMQTQGRFNFFYKSDDLENIKREVIYVLSNKHVRDVFITNDKSKITHSSSKIYKNLDLKTIYSKDILEKIEKIKESQMGEVFFKSKRDLFAIYPINLGVDSNKIVSNRFGALIIHKDLKNLEDIIRYEESRSVLIPMAIYFFSILAIAGILYFHFLNRIKLIIESTREFSKGNYVKGKVYGRDEIFELSKAFDDMFDRLKQQESNLQDSINLLNQYKSAVDYSSIVSKTDKRGKITYVNEKFCKVTGFEKDDLIGKSHSILRHPTTPNSLIKNIWDSLKKGTIWSGFIKDRKKDGSTFFSKLTIVPIKDSKDNITEFIALRDNVTELIQNKEKLRKTMHTDSLTNLSNRFEMLIDLKKSYSPILVVFNIDNFKVLNDYYGCKVGDFVLVEFAKLLDETFSKEGAKCYRFHADEFAIVKSVHKKYLDEFLESVKSFIKYIEKIDLKYENHKLNINISAGVAFNEKDLLIKADIALKNARENQKYMLLYSEALKSNQNYQDTIKWADKLKDAIKDDRIVPFSQAIYNNKTGKIEKYECLVRLIDEDGKVISPFFFLDISKKIRVYSKMMEIMVVKSFKKFENSDFNFSINLTVEDILNTEFIKFLFEKVDEFNVANRVIFELVESEGIENFDEVIAFIERAKESNCQIAIDDFGTGYSNFEYLLKIDADFIKIDGSMIKNIDRDENSKEVVQTIVDFAKKRNLKTIAEFVSSKEIFDKVKEIGIDYSQGYFIAEPKAEI